MATTKASLAKALQISTRWLSEYQKRGMPLDLEDPDIVSKCKRWKANNIDSHRGGWSSRGKRTDGDKQTDSLLEIKIEKLKIEAETLRRVNNRKNEQTLVRPAYANCLAEIIEKLRAFFPVLTERIMAKQIELEGQYREEARHTVEHQMRSLESSLLGSTICDQTIADWINENEANELGKTWIPGGTDYAGYRQPGRIKEDG